MNFSFTTLRWVFLVLYVILLVTVAGISIAADKQEGLLWVVILGPVILFTQFLMVAATSKVNFCGAHQRYAIWVPALIAGLMFGFLSFGFLMGISEVFYLQSSLLAVVLWAIIPISWIIWTVIFAMRYRGAEPDSATGKILKWVLVGSVLEMLALLPMHIITSSRGGCFAGIMTAIGLITGACVAFWSFGPGIVLLFIRHYKKQKEKATLRG